MSSFFCLFHPCDKIADHKPDEHHKRDHDNPGHPECPKQELKLHDLGVLEDKEEKQDKQDQDNDNFRLHFNSFIPLFFT